MVSIIEQNADVAQKVKQVPSVIFGDFSKEFIDDSLEKLKKDTKNPAR